MCLTRKYIKSNKCEICKISCMCLHTTDIPYPPSLSRQKAEIHQVISKKNNGGDSNGTSPHSPSLHLGHIVHRPSRRRHAQCLLGPSFHDPKTPHVFESHPSESRLSPAATMSDDMQSALTPPLPCASMIRPATPPQVVAFKS